MHLIVSHFNNLLCLNFQKCNTHKFSFQLKIVIAQTPSSQSVVEESARIEQLYLSTMKRLKEMRRAHDEILALEKEIQTSEQNIASFSTSSSVGQSQQVMGYSTGFWMSGPELSQVLATPLHHNQETSEVMCDEETLQYTSNLTITNQQFERNPIQFSISESDQAEAERTLVGVGLSSDLNQNHPLNHESEEDMSLFLRSKTTGKVGWKTISQFYLSLFNSQNRFHMQCLTIINHVIL